MGHPSTGKTLLFVIGPALGHAARAIGLARALARRGFTVIAAGPEFKAGHLDRLFRPDFETLTLPADPLEFSQALVRLEKQLRPEAICYDLSPTPWLVFHPRLDTPEVYVTNFVLTGLNGRTTLQDRQFASHGGAWNETRQALGLQPLRSIRDLYERGRVLLADPPLLVSEAGLPDHYRIMGPATWEPEIEMPEALLKCENTLYVALGSTGTRPLPTGFLDALSARLNCEAIICHDASGMDARIPVHEFPRLPGGQVARRAGFVLTQGGAGSVYQALLQGAPIGCWPSHLNHSVLAGWLESSGLAMEFGGETWRERIDALPATAAQLRDRAREVARSLSDVDCAARGAAHIAHFL